MDDTDDDGIWATIEDWLSDSLTSLYDPSSLYDEDDDSGGAISSSNEVTGAAAGVATGLGGLLGDDDSSGLSFTSELFIFLVLVLLILLAGAYISREVLG